jgi:hypothetical protein
MAEITKVSITDIDSGEISNKNIWVLNRTGKESNTIRSEIGIAIDNGDKPDLMLKIPNTGLPICVSDQINSEILLKSSRFRQTIHKGIICLVEANSARKFRDSIEGNVASKVTIRDDDVVSPKNLNIVHKETKKDINLSKFQILLDTSSIDDENWVSKTEEIKDLILGGYVPSNKERKEFKKLIKDTKEDTTQGRKNLKIAYKFMNV